mgnify:CR=1 FL=1
MQVVDFTSKLLQTIWDISRKGARSDQVEFEAMAEDLRSHARALIAIRNESNITANHAEPPVDKLALNCEAVTNELLAALNSLQVKKGPKRWRSFAQALRSIWHEDKIRELQEGIDRIDHAVTNHSISTELCVLSKRPG